MVRTFDSIEDARAQGFEIHGDNVTILKHRETDEDAIVVTEPDERTKLLWGASEFLCWLSERSRLSVTS